MRKRLPLAKQMFVIAAVIVLVPFFVGPDPNAELKDFAVAHEDLSNAKIVMFKGARSTYCELRIETNSGNTFYLREPEPATLETYVDRFPSEGSLIIHYRDTMDGHQIIDVRDAKTVLIPISETMASVRQKQNIIFATSGIFALLGLLAHWWERHKKHQQT